ncbi:MAG: hypothetical protein ACK4QW_18965 [Alphaproteobacteria bacterium]
MTVRTTTTAVTFAKPFVLRGFGEVLPAGTYEVEVDEEQVQGLSFLTYRRVRAIIQLGREAGDPARTRSLTIEPEDLDRAIAEDRAPSPAPLATGFPAVPTWPDADQADLDRAADEGMTAAPRTGFPAKPGPTQGELDAYGITRVPVDYFHYRSFRYTTFGDTTRRSDERSASNVAATAGPRHPCQDDHRDRPLAAAVSISVRRRHSPVGVTLPALGQPTPWRST